jgi:2-polyprenyl-6-methoxyphenol hydroxylase-like FAD-dependent oxidoreductase
MKIVVVGAGIAGLACAIAMADRGHEVELAERRPEGRSEGAGVILWDRACRVLDGLGLLDSVAPRAEVLHGLVRRQLDGTVIDTFDFRGNNTFAALAVRRAHLVDAMTAAARHRGVTLGFDLPAVSVLAAGGADAPAVLGLGDGRRVEADLVVGADGRMNSVVGARVRGIARMDQGLVTWVASAPSLGDRLAQVAVDLWAPGARLGVVPCGDGGVYWAATARSDLVPATRPWRETVQSLLPDRDGLVRDVLAATPEDAVHRHDLFDLEPGGPWHLGRLVLVGDAAHASLPTTGQGAAEALVDASVLAGLLPRSPDLDMLNDALARYVGAREAAARAGVLAARQVARRVFHPASAR